jgi:hypothetical protein
MFSLELADPFFTPDAYLNPKSYPTKIMFSEVTTTTTLSGSAWRITSIGSFTSGAVLGFGYSAYKSITDFFHRHNKTYCLSYSLQDAQ